MISCRTTWLALPNSVQTHPFIFQGRMLLLKQERRMTTAMRGLSVIHLEWQWGHGLEIMTIPPCRKKSRLSSFPPCGTRSWKLQWRNIQPILSPRQHQARIGILCRRFCGEIGIQIRKKEYMTFCIGLIRITQEAAVPPKTH